ncbi:MAG: hypothetical protein NTW87_09210 [Planctomycetota bacterium]|nr:hypothetical protein [Planctomycetota bacterium]
MAREEMSSTGPEWLHIVAAYLDTFGEQSRRLRRKLLCEFEAAPGTELAEALLQEATTSRSPYALDSAVDFLAAIDTDILQRLFDRARFRREANVDFWDILAGGIARSNATTETRLGLLRRLLDSESQATRGTAVAALARMAHNGVSEAISELQTLAYGDDDETVDDETVKEEARLALDDLT